MEEEMNSRGQKPVAFRSMVRGATGGGEVWSHTDENMKMRQFGWRCTNSESLYESGTLIGNWNESRFDLKEIKKNKPLPSQCAHYYTSTQAEAYNTDPLHRQPEDLKLYKDRLPHAYSIHQPELDSNDQKAVCNSWQTTQRGDYIAPQLRLAPIKGPPNQPLPSM